MKKKLFLIGSSGMLGHVLVKFLKLKNQKVIEILRKKSGNSKIKNIYYFKNFQSPELLKLIKNLKPTHIINCAGMINHRINKKI